MHFWQETDSSPLTHFKRFRCEQKQEGKQGRAQVPAETVGWNSMLVWVCLLQEPDTVSISRPVL